MRAAIVWLADAGVCDLMANSAGCLAEWPARAGFVPALLRFADAMAQRAKYLSFHYFIAECRCVVVAGAGGDDRDCQ